MSNTDELLDTLTPSQTPLQQLPGGTTYSYSNILNLIIMGQSSHSSAAVVSTSILPSPPNAVRWQGHCNWWPSCSWARALTQSVAWCRRRFAAGTSDAMPVANTYFILRRLGIARSCVSLASAWTVTPCSSACEWVSEQFLNGTSAQYRLCSAILLKLHKS